MLQPAARFFPREVPVKDFADVLSCFILKSKSINHLPCVYFRCLIPECHFKAPSVEVIEFQDVFAEFKFFFKIF